MRSRILSQNAIIKAGVLSGEPLRPTQETGVVLHMGRPLKPINVNAPPECQAICRTMRRLLAERKIHHKKLCVPFGDNEAAMSEGNVSKLLSADQLLQVTQIKAFCDFLKISMAEFFKEVENENASELERRWDQWVKAQTPEQKAGLLEFIARQSA